MSKSGDVDAEGEDGMDWATERKKSNMYWRDVGSYCKTRVSMTVIYTHTGDLYIWLSESMFNSHRSDKYHLH